MILDDIVDEYCDPLTSVGVNTSLGYTTPYTSTDLTPLKVFEDLRRKYNFLYFVDADWDVQVYKKSEIGPSESIIRYGEEGE